MPRKPLNRDRLLEEGQRLLSRQGFAATGVQEITDAAAVPKGSFYNYFDSKEEFAIAVLDRYREQACEHLDAALVRSPGSALDRLRSLFEEGRQEIVSTDFAGGCLAGRLAQELAGEHACFRQPLDDAFRCMKSYIEKCLVSAREAGELAAAVDASQLAEFIVLAWQGAMLRAKAAHSAAPLETFLQVIFDHVLKRHET